MKKSILSIALAFSGYASAQVGIGTDTPKATLDISVSNSNNQSKAITINSINDPTNSLNKDYFTLYNDGSLNIGGAFKPNNDAGVNESYLVSNGPNNPPKWEVLNKKVIFNTFQNILTSFKGTTLTSGKIEDVRCQNEWEISF